MLTVTEMLRKKGVVDKFVEFFGDGLANLPLADRATIANMAPEFGSTCGIFPIDEETLRYLELSGRPREQIALVEAYAQGAGHVARERRSRRPTTPTCSSSISAPSSRASRARSVRRIACRCATAQAASIRPRSRSMAEERKTKNPGATGMRRDPARRQDVRGQGRRGADRRDHELHQHLESRVLIAAGLLARNAAKLGLKPSPG